jgi:hypothetical protein
MENDWKHCQDEHYGFTVYYPPDWEVVRVEGRCVQLRKGTGKLPEGVPEVDVAIRVAPFEGHFEAYLNSNAAPAAGDVGRGVQYRNRQLWSVNDLQIVRAEFRSSGPTPNWGVEYAILKGGLILDFYISQPEPAVEKLFDEVVTSLKW